MALIRHKRNGQVIQEPRNFQELEITKDFLNRNEDASINITQLNIVGEEAIKIIERIKNGLNGGVGIFEGDFYDIEVGEIGNPAFAFQGYLDYAAGVQVLGCNEVEVQLKKRRGRDWLNDVADGFSFRYLFDKGEIKNSDFVKVPYIINYIPDGVQLILLSISTFMMTKEAIEAVKQTAEAVADLIDASVPVVGAGVGAGAVVVTAWDIGNIILTGLKVIAYVVYTIAIVIAIINLIEQIFEQLMPKKRFHLGMRLQKLFEKGCNYLGLNLKSRLLQERRDWVVIPSKGHKGGEKPTGFKGNFIESGVPNANDGFDTFGDLIRVWSSVFNADWRIVGNDFIFERRDYWEEVSSYVIQDVFSNQKTLLDEYKPNTDEIIANYNINYAYDTQDQNTLDNQTGRVFQAITEPNIIINKDLVNMKNLQEIGVPCSLGVRKDELTGIEKALKLLAKTVDDLTGVFGNGTNFSAKIEARKGSLLLSSHFLTIPKLVVVSGANLARSQRDILSSRRLWDELHYINSFAEVNGDHNQYLRYEGVKVKFCMSDFVTLLNNNYCKTVDGEEAMIESLKWKVWQDYAIIDYRVKKKYTNNLKITYIE